MRGALAVTFAAGASVLLMAGPGAPAQAVSSPRVRNVRFELQLSANPGPVTFNSELRLSLHLVSHATRPWLIYPDLQQGPGASIELSVKDHLTGQETSPAFFADAHVPPGPLHLTRLAPGACLSSEIMDRPQAFGMQPGHTYDITATYHSPLHESARHHTPVLSTTDGPISSNTVHLAISP